MQAFKDFIAKPFSADMDAAHWGAFLVFVLGVVVLFNVALRHVTEA